jgi:hypothetical protein
VYVLASHVLSSHSYLYLHLRVHLRIKDTLLSVFPIKTPTRVIDGGEAQRERERERERDNGVLFSIIFVVSWVGGFSLFEETIGYGYRLIALEESTLNGGSLIGYLKPEGEKDQLTIRAGYSQPQTLCQVRSL